MTNLWIRTFSDLSCGTGELDSLLWSKTAAQESCILENGDAFWLAPSATVDVDYFRLAWAAKESALRGVRSFKAWAPSGRDSAGARLDGSHAIWRFLNPDTIYVVYVFPIRQASIPKTS